MVCRPGGGHSDSCWSIGFGKIPQNFSRGPGWQPMGSTGVGGEYPLSLVLCCWEPPPAPSWEGGPLTQMRHAAEAGVEADLAHLVGARQEEVDHAVCDHAAWETHELVVEAAPLPEAVPAAWCTRLHTQHLPVGGGEARNFSHRAPHLSGVGGWLQ